MARWGKEFLVLVFLCIGSLGVQGKEYYDPTSDLLTSFGSQCSSLGRATQNAVSQTDSLKQIIQAIDADKLCNNLVTALSSIDITNSQLDSLYKMDNKSQQEKQLKAQIDDYLFAIQNNSDPNYQFELLTRMANSQSELIVSQSSEDIEKEQLKYQGTKNLLFYTQNLFSALRANPECLGERPGLALQIGAQVVALSSNWVAASQAPFIFAGGAIADQFFSLISSKKYSKWIKKSQNSKMGIALSCAMESLSKSYCEAKDSSQIVKSYIQSKSHPVGDADDWEGLALLQKDSRKYLPWIRKVVTGTLASSPSAIAEKVEGYELETALKASEDLINATYNSYYEKLNRSEAKTNDLLRRFIDDLLEAMSTVVVSSITGSRNNYSDELSNKSPFYYVFSEDTRCGPKWYLYTGAVSGGRNDLGSCKEFSEIPPPPLSLLKERYETKIIEAQQAVSLEVSLVRETDPGFILALAEEGGDNSPTALEFLGKVIGYLEHLRAAYPGKIPQHTLSLLDDTILRVEQSLSALRQISVQLRAKSSDLGVLNNSDYFETITQLQEWLAPKQNSFLITKRLRQFVNWEINYKLKNKKLSEYDEVEKVVDVVLDDKVSTLLDYGVINLDSVEMDARFARQVSQQNLDLLAEVFSEQLINYSKKLIEKMNTSEDASDSLDQLCIQILSIPKMNSLLGQKVGYVKNKSVTLQYICSQRSLKSIYGESGLNVIFSSQSGSEFKERACTFYEWERSARIFSYKISF